MRETRDSKGRVRIDEKHSLDIQHTMKNDGDAVFPVDTPFILKSTNDQPIPDNEPRILFRGRDQLALPMLYYYRDLCIMDGATKFQLASIDKMIKEFVDFEKENKSKMKQPGITGGK